MASPAAKADCSAGTGSRFTLSSVVKNQPLCSNVSARWRIARARPTARSRCRSPRRASVLTDEPDKSRETIDNYADRLRAASLLRASSRPAWQPKARHGAGLGHGFDQGVVDDHDFPGAVSTQGLQETKSMEAFIRGRKSWWPESYGWPLGVLLKK